ADADLFFQQLEAEMNPDRTQDPLYALMQSYMPVKALRMHSIVEATILTRSADGFIASIKGVKSDGLLPFDEAAEGVAIGDTVKASVIGLGKNPEVDGYLLSEIFAGDWIKLEESHTQGLPVDAQVEKPVYRGKQFMGLKVKFGRVPVFVPSFQLPY